MKFFFTLFTLKKSLTLINFPFTNTVNKFFKNIIQLFLIYHIFCIKVRRWIIFIICIIFFTCSRSILLFHTHWLIIIRSIFLLYFYYIKLLMWTTLYLDWIVLIRNLSHWKLRHLHSRKTNKIIILIGVLCNNWSKVSERSKIGCILIKIVIEKKLIQS
jgi:hypothetical protein